MYVDRKRLGAQRRILKKSKKLKLKSTRDYTHTTANKSVNLTHNLVVIVGLRSFIQSKANFLEKNTIQKEERKNPINNERVDVDGGLRRIARKSSLEICL